MRKIISFAFITIDGVMQAPGGPEEDTSGGFLHGGWTAPFEDEASGKFMQKLLEPADLLLGRKTYQIFASYWPKHAEYWPGINEVTKYVLSSTLDKADWENTAFLKNVADIEKLKSTEGSNINVWGSSKLVQLLLKNNLLDELWLFIHPIILGNGKKLFDKDVIPAAYKLVESYVSPSGVIMVNYQKAGEVKTGNAGEAM